MASSSRSDDKPSLSYRDAGVDIDAGNALVERIKPLAAATRRPGDFVEYLAARFAFPEQECLNNDALSLCLYGCTVRFLPVRLAIGKEHNHSRCARPSVCFEFLECRENASGEIRAAGFRQTPQCTNDLAAIRCHGLGKFTVPVEADDTDLDIASRREVLDQADGARGAKVFRIGALETRRRIHDKNHVEILHATDCRRDALYLDGSFAPARDEVGGR